jgi:large subunit ribosomal protein L1
MNKEKFSKAVKELISIDSQRTKKRNFDQTVDMIINLKNFDVRRESFNTVIILPHEIKNKRVAGFFEKDSELIDTIKKGEFVKYKDKKEIKKLVKTYDNFIANAKLMPAIATSFGRVLGPVGKMPSPQLGIVPNEDETLVKSVLKKFNTAVKVIVKEPSIKFSVGKASLGEEKISENLVVAINKILESLPKKSENIKNIKIKFTMSKPVIVE